MAAEQDTTGPERSPVGRPAANIFGLSKNTAIMALIAMIAAVVAMSADGAPTGNTAWDAVLKGLVAAVFVCAVANSPKWVAIIVATIAAVFLGDSVWLASAGVGLLLAIGAAALPRRLEWMVAASAGLAIQGLLRLPSIEFFGLPSLIAGAAILLAFIFGYRDANASSRGVIQLAIAAIVLAVTAISVVGGVVLLSARTDVEQGISAARSGLSAARDGDPQLVADELELAAQALSRAEDRSTSLLAKPLSLLPVLAQNRHAITTATRHGSAIARQASLAIIEADITSISMNAGSVDLSALAAMEGDLVTTADLLQAGVSELDGVQSPWLVSPVASRMEDLTEEMRSVLPEARVAADAAQIVPGLLGQDAPRRYFVGFGSPAESRELGGFIGSWAVIEFDAGRVRQIEGGRVRDLYDLARSQEPLSTDDFPPWYVLEARPARWPQNVTSTPQLRAVADASRLLFDGLGGGSIDGFVYLDAYALTAMLAITGPISLDGVDRPLNTRNGNNFFFNEQYRLDDRDSLKADLSQVFGVAFEGILDTQLPGPERLGRILGPVARQGRLQVATYDDAENEFLESIKLQRVFGSPFTTSDSLALVQANASASKLDLYLHREVIYDVEVNNDGELKASVQVVLTSDIPDDAPEYTLGTNSPGVNELYFSLYSRHPIISMQVGDDEVVPRVTAEFGFFRYQVTVAIAANTSSVVQYELAGRIDPSRNYDLDVWHQPLVNDDIMQVSYRRTSQPRSTQDLKLVENTTVSFDD